MNTRIKNIVPVTSVILGTPFLMVAGYLTICLAMLYYGMVRGRHVDSLSHFCPTEKMHA